MVTSSHEALITGFVCSGCSMAILLLRIVTARIQNGRFDLSSIICVASIVVVSARLAVNQFVLSYGTVNDALFGKSDYFDAEDLRRLKVGSILSLVARLLITTFYWMQNCLLLLFYSHIFSQVRVRWATVLIRMCWVAIPLTYIAVVLATLLECHPLKLYWQVKPRPGHCIRAYIQLLTQGISNIVLDLLLLAIAIPLLRVQNRSLAERLRIGTIFTLGFFCIVITCARVALIYATSSFQPTRSLWASVQMLVACFVANTPMIYGSFKLIRRRKSEQVVRRGSRPELWLHLQVMNGDIDSSNEPVLSHQVTNSPALSEKAYSRWIP